MRVTIVIPGRDCADTLSACLSALVPFVSRGEAEEIVFIDDESSDETPRIARSFSGVRVLEGEGRGPGAARNLGWRAASSDLIWFVDADCVAEPDALRHLEPHLMEPDVAAVGGTYSNGRPASLLACLIHEEIVERHRRMPTEVSHLATFNVIYRRSVLEAIDGFDERFLKAQDADLAYRARKAGYRLRFEPRSRVAHFHETRLGAYLSTQRSQGYWRILLHRIHPDTATGDTYSGTLDHLQPPLALVALVSTPLLVLDGWWPLLPLALFALLVAAALPMATSMAGRTGRASMLLFALLSPVRAVWRGFGALAGILSWTMGRDQAGDQ